MVSAYIAFGLKFFFLFTPFFALSMFLAMTADRSPAERRALAISHMTSVGRSKPAAVPVAETIAVLALRRDRNEVLVSLTTIGSL